MNGNKRKIPILEEIRLYCLHLDQHHQECPDILHLPDNEPFF